MVEFAEKAKQILERIRGYVEDKDGWKHAKKTDDVTVWYKPSPHWNGALYKAEAVINADPETVFKYIEPTPDGPRGRWDKAVKGLEVLEKISEELSIVRTLTHSAFGGLISSRDFVDLCVTDRTDDYISTNASAVVYSKCPENPGQVRGTNHPCAIICYKQKDPNQTLVASYIQTDLGGMLPKSLVENALPSNMCDFFECLKKVLKEDGQWKEP